MAYWAEIDLCENIGGPRRPGTQKSYSHHQTRSRITLGRNNIDIDVDVDVDVDVIVIVIVSSTHLESESRRRAGCAVTVAPSRIPGCTAGPSGTNTATKGLTNHKWPTYPWWV